MGNDVDALDLFYLQSKSKSQRQGIVFPMSQEEEEEEEEEPHLILPYRMNSDRKTSFAKCF